MGFSSEVEWENQAFFLGGGGITNPNFSFPRQGFPIALIFSKKIEQFYFCGVLTVAVPSYGWPLCSCRVCDYPGLMFNYSVIRRNNYWQIGHS